MKIPDAKGREWTVRFREKSTGWSWEARYEDYGQGPGAVKAFSFKTKALAEADARHEIQSEDAIAAGDEFFRRLQEPSQD